MAIDVSCFASNDLVAKVSAVMKSYVESRPHVFSGFFLVMNTGAVDKVGSMFSATTRTDPAGLKMGLSLRIEYAENFLLNSSWYAERSKMLDTWGAALTNAGATYSLPTVTNAHVQAAGTPVSAFA